MMLHGSNLRSLYVALASYIHSLSYLRDLLGASPVQSPTTPRRHDKIEIFPRALLSLCSVDSLIVYRGSRLP